MKSDWLTSLGALTRWPHLPRCRERRHAVEGVKKKDWRLKKRFRWLATWAGKDARKLGRGESRVVKGGDLGTVKTRGTEKENEPKK